VSTAAQSQSAPSAAPLTGAEVRRLREDFPILSRKVHGKPLVYLDSGATAHKPRAVIDAVRNVYENLNSNVHRGVHLLSQEATAAFEGAREKARRFLNASDTREIVFVRGTTEAINLVAQSHARPLLHEGDEVLITHMEHHSNIVPWQILCQQTGAKLRVVPINDAGELEMDELDKLLSPRTKMVGLIHVSNALGTINPVREIVHKAHNAGATVLVDGAQAVPHGPVDVRELGADFYAFSGHKLFGPTGIGVLYGRADLLERMPPWQGGGDMIRSVSFEKTIYNELPYKFEAGTPNIAGTIGLGAAIDYVQQIGPSRIAAYEAELLRYATEAVSSVPGVRLIGTAAHKAAIVSFVMDDIHPHDLGTVLDRRGVAIRTGHHCAQPVMDRFGIPATARASLALYNTPEEIDALVDGLRAAVEMFGGLGGAGGGQGGGR
jgi:cysteine desulfurase / selenocysteine lyase